MDVHAIRTVPITFKMVVDSYGKVRKGGKAAGIDDQSWEDFDKDVQGHLYVLWNRLASGSYFPSAVKEVEIPKKDGRKRKLGVPTLRDRIAQGVIKDYMEIRIDHHFHKHSYGYRPMKNAHQALSQVRKNCQKIDWVIDLDIKNYFDEIDHELVLKAVENLIEEKWVRMYVKRWLEAKIQKVNGEEVERDGKGTPQGGVISPLLANLFLHYALDKWLEKNYSEINFVRYADDVIIHCRSKQEAEDMLKAVSERLRKVRLRLNEEKTQIVYCSDYRRKLKQSKVEFGFLGFSYRPRKTKSKVGAANSFTIYAPDISSGNYKKLTEAIRSRVMWRNTTMKIEDIAQLLNPRIRGWINYFGKFNSRRLRSFFIRLEVRLLRWLMKKLKLSGIRKAVKILKAIKANKPRLFAHWQHPVYCLS